MAITTTVLLINFNAAWTGLHRVCWRIGGVGAYDCSTIINASIGPNTASITVEIDNETCDDVEYDGYVQALCNDEGSLDGRIPFVITFTPQPACKSFLVTCVNVGILSVTITDGGTGYIDGSPPAISFVGGAGSGATATATVVGGIITVITVTAPGSGFTSVPAVSIPPPGAGDQATATAILDKCPEFTPFDCTGSDLSATPVGELALNETIEICTTTAFTAPTDQFTSVADGNCLCDCETLSVEVDGASPSNVDVQYTLCNGAFVSVTLEPNDTLEVCIAPGSFLVVPEAGAVYTSGTTPGCA